MADMSLLRGDTADKMELLGQLWPFILLFAYPALCLSVLKKFKDKLHEPKVKGRIGNLYENVHLTRNKYTLYSYPLFLGRRLAFVMIPTVLMNFSWIQLQFLVTINQAHAMYVGLFRPMVLRERNRVNLFNEFMLINLSCLMFCFSDYVESETAKFTMGKQFIWYMIILFLVNVLVMMKNTWHRFWRNKRIKKTQDAYVKVFKEYQEAMLRLKNERKRIRATNRIKKGM